MLSFSMASDQFTSSFAPFEVSVVFVDISRQSEIGYFAYFVGGQ
jgi:hypothetical protein